MRLRVPLPAALQKPSKSQKRRDQRQREEAEREARIQAELAEAGDTGEAWWYGSWHGAACTALPDATPPTTPYLFSPCRLALPQLWHELTLAITLRDLRGQACLPCSPLAARAIEERELQTILAPLGLSVHAIPPDGHCLYRALGERRTCISV